MSDQKELVEFDQLQAEVTKFFGQALKAQVTDARSSADAVLDLKTIKDYEKKVKRRLEDLVDPLKKKIEFYKALAAKVQLPLEKAEDHLRGQVDGYAAEQYKIQERARKEEADRVRRENEAAEKKRAQEEAAAEAKRKADLAALERARPPEPAPQRRSSFGRALSSDDEREAARKALEEKHEQQRLERDAKAERERLERESQASARQYDIRKQNVSGTRKDYEIEIDNIDLVPVHLLKRELRINEAKAAYKAGGLKPIPGLTFKEKIGVAIGAATHVPRQLLESERPPRSGNE